MQAGSACLLAYRNQLVHDVILRSSCRGLQQRPRHLSASPQQQAVLQVTRSAPSCTPCTAASAASWQHTAAILDSDVQINMQGLLLERHNSHAGAGPRSSSPAELQDCSCGAHSQAGNMDTVASSNGSNEEKCECPASIAPAPSTRSSAQDAAAATGQQWQQRGASSAGASCEQHTQQQLESQQQHGLHDQQQGMLLQHTRLGSLGDMLIVQDMSISSSDEPEFSSSSGSDNVSVAANIEQSRVEQTAGQQISRRNGQAKKQRHWSKAAEGSQHHHQQQQQQLQSLQQPAIDVLQQHQQLHLQSLQQPAIDVLQQHQQLHLQQQPLQHVYQQQQSSSWSAASAATHKQQQQQHGRVAVAESQLHWPIQQQWQQQGQARQQLGLGPADDAAWVQQAQADLHQRIKQQQQPQLGAEELLQQQQQQWRRQQPSYQQVHDHHHHRSHHQQQQQQVHLHWQHQARLQQAQAAQLLSTHIAAAASWQEVRQLLDIHETSPSMQPLHVVLLLVRLNQLLLLHPQPGGAALPAARHEQAEYMELVQCLLRMAGRSLQQLSQHELPPLVAAAARLPLAPVSKPWCVRSMTRAHHLMPKFTAEGIATLVWGFAKLGMNFRADFTAKVLQEFQLKLSEASPRALAVLVHGLAGVGVRPEGLWMGVYFDTLQRQLGRFSGKDLCMCLWALVQLRHVVPTALLTAALQRVITVLPHCSGHEAALAIWALAKLGHRFGSSSSSNSSSGGNAAANNSYQQQQHQGSGRQQQQQYKHRHKLGKVQKQLLGGLKPLLPQLSGRDLTTLLYGLALQHSTPPADWQAAALSAALSQMHQLDGQGLSNLLWAVGKLGWQPSEQWQVQFWDAVVTQVQLPQQEQKQHHKQRSRRKQQQQQQGSAGSGSWAANVPLSQQSSGVVASQVPGAGFRVAGALLSGPVQAGFVPRTWELLFEGQRLLGWRLPLHQLQLLQQQGQLHRLRQAQLGSWARQAGLAAAAAAPGREGDSGLRSSTHVRPAGGSVQQQQQPRRQLFRHVQQQAQVQQQQRRPVVGIHGNSSTASITVEQLRVLPPVQLPAGTAAAAVHQPSTGAAI